jgi:hypothetical protein
VRPLDDAALTKDVLAPRQPNRQRQERVVVSKADGAVRRLWVLCCSDERLPVINDNATRGLHVTVVTVVAVVAVVVAAVAVVQVAGPMSPGGLDENLVRCRLELPQAGRIQELWGIHNRLARPRRLVRVLRHGAAAAN